MINLKELFEFDVYYVLEVQFLDGRVRYLIYIVLDPEASWGLFQKNHWVRKGKVWINGKVRGLETFQGGIFRSQVSIKVEVVHSVQE